LRSSDLFARHGAHFASPHPSCGPAYPSSQRSDEANPVSEVGGGRDLAFERLSSPRAPIVDGPTPTFTSLPGRIAGWFARAPPPTPLTLHILDKKEKDYSSWANKMELVDVACESRPWRELDIALPINAELAEDWDENVLWRVCVDGAWKDLRRLAMDCCRMPTPRDTDPLPEGITPLDTVAPELQELKLRVRSMNVALPGLHQKISVLHLHLINVNAGFIATRVVGNLPSLRQLSVKGESCARWRMWPAVDSPDFSDDISQVGNLLSGARPVDVVVSNTIEEVNVDEDGVYILNYLRLPRLKRVRACNVGSRRAFIAALVALIYRSRCDETLEVVDVDEAVLGEIMQHLNVSLAERLKLQM
jgi:hypothetical protein